MANTQVDSVYFSKQFFELVYEPIMTQDAQSFQSENTFYVFAVILPKFFLQLWAQLFVKDQASSVCLLTVVICEDEAKKLGS